LVLVNLADRVRGPRPLIARSPHDRKARSLHGPGCVRSAVPARIQIHDFDEAIGGESGAALDSGRQFNTQDFSSYFCTGGTTGSPKLAMRRHGNEVANAWSTGQFLGDVLGPGKTVFCGLPLSHVNSVLLAGLLPFSTGAHVLLGTPEGYRGQGVIQRFWEIVEHHRVSFFSAVPTVYSALLEVPLAGRDISSLEYGLCGAAPMPVQVFRSFQERTGTKIIEGYGLTEGTCVSSVNPPFGERRLGSIGLRIPGQRMKPIVVDDEGRYVRDCESDEAGLLVICGPNVFAGYVQPEHSRQLWLDLGDGQRWLNTGDLGRCDAQGYFWLVGRKKDLIIRGGHNIDPASIEEPLHRHPAVQLAAAIGRPDAHAGEVPVAYVQLRLGTPATEQQLLEFARSEITERAAVPKQVHIVQRMPLTGVGKIFKPELRRRETSSAVQSALAEGGVEVRRVGVEESDSTGVSLSVDLADPAAENRAREILARFPFVFSITSELAPSQG
jgi:fatty-acyl-CoA synthase